jgi:hypothetical protein
MGRPRGSSTEAAKLRRALKRVEKRRGIDFYEKFVEMALDNPGVMVALMRKLVPDLKVIEPAIEQPENRGGVIVVLPDNGRGDLFPEEPIAR